MKYPSKTFFTADLHLGHAGILKHCNRPWNNTEEMDEAIIKNWNDTVPKRAITFILGDLAFKNHAQYIHRLNGKKIFIAGNHDSMSLVCRDMFREYHTFGLVRKFQRQKIVMCHYRMATWEDSHRGSWHLYGHSHGRLPEERHVMSCDIGVDVWDYKPVPLEVIQTLMKSKDLSLRKFDPKWKVDKRVEQNRQYHMAIWKVCEEALKEDE